MLHFIRRSAVLLLLLVLLLPISPVPPAVAGGPSAMPPDPILWDKIRRGEVQLPRFLTDRAWARRVGLESPQGPPKRLTGAINVLAVAVDFSDNVHTVTASYFDSLLFAAPVAGRGSVRDYYNEVSYAQVDIVTVNLPSSLGWQRAPQTYAYYVAGQHCTDAPYPNNCQKLAEDVVDAINGVVDFSNYDNDGDGEMEPIVLIHAGTGAEHSGSPNDIWSHSWGLYNPRNYDGVWVTSYVIQPEYWDTVSPSTSDMTIGVFAHEMGHGFWHLPDVYDRDYTSGGVGSWSLMAGGSWNGPWSSRGSSPAWPDAYCRTLMGFVTPTNITSNQTGYAIPQAYNNPAPAHTVLKLRSAALGASEYFLVENRQQVAGSYEEYLPGAGLFIWHVDEDMLGYSLWNDYECTSEPQCNCSDSQHYLLALQQADGLHELELGADSGDAGDPFPGSTNKHSWNMTTAPGSSSWYDCQDTCIGVDNIGNSGATMTADLQVTCGPPVVPTNFVYLPIVLKRYSGVVTPPVTLQEGFEGGVVPPAGWTRVQTNPRQTWKIATIGSPHGGSYFADCEYDDYTEQQDEWLLSPQVQLSSGTLSFWSFGSLSWCRDINDNCDLEVWLVVGALGGGDDVYLGLADDDWTASWVWSQSTFNLTPYLPGGPVRIGFRYHGLDGAQIALDDISLNGLPLAVRPAR